MQESFLLQAVADLIMKTTQKIQIDDVVGITCDRCKQSFAKDDVEWHEFHSIEFVGGYYSVFGDGNTVSVDLCQHCIKETIAPWIRVSTPTISDDALLGVQQSAERACAAIDETLQVVEESNQRIADMEDAAKQPNDDTSISDAISRLKGSLRPPSDRHVTIEEMRVYRGQGGRTRKTYQLDELIKEMPGDLQSQEWASGTPVGVEFGAGHARFNLVHAQALITFGNPLDALWWLMTNNSVLRARPMQLAIDSEDGCAEVLDVLVSLTQ